MTLLLQRKYFEDGKEQKVYTHSKFYQNKFTSNQWVGNSNNGISKFNTLKYKLQEAQKPMTIQISDQKPTKRYYVNVLAAGLQKRQTFINITNNKEIRKRNDQEEKNKLNINNLPNQEVSIKQKVQQLKATGLG